MDGPKTDRTHAADGAALGFWFQSLYALLTLISLNTDDAAIGIEQMDDVELTADGQTLLYQLKHSLSELPPPVSIKSRSVWRTIKVWTDALPSLVLSETKLFLVTVAGIAPNDPLRILTTATDDRNDLVAAMTAEAERVRQARAVAAEAGKPLPYADRVDGCEAFLGLSQTDRLNLLRCTTIKHGSPTVVEVEREIANHLYILPAGQRPFVVSRLVEWWDRQIVYSLCGVRERIITRAELQARISTIIADIDQGRLIPDFETVSHPEDYQPDGMLTRQIELVAGNRTDIAKAIREEWRAREQRSRWIDGDLAMASKINDYDLVLQEHWSDRHTQLIEECANLEERGKRTSGLQLLRWTHNEAPTIVRPIAEGWSAPYYVRGSYQVLAINLKVGWHPEYKSLLDHSK